MDLSFQDFRLSPCKEGNILDFTAVRSGSPSNNGCYHFCVNNPLKLDLELELDNNKMSCRDTSE